jgi:hypothetical protein
MNDTVITTPIKDYFSNMRVADVVRAVGKYFAIITGSLALIWGAGRPYIDSYIKTSVAQEYATQNQIRAVEQALKDVTSSVGEITDKLPDYEKQFKEIQMDQVRTKIIADETRSIVRDTQLGIGELNTDVKMMLRDFRSINNMAPYSNARVPLLSEQ